MGRRNRVDSSDHTSKHEYDPVSMSCVVRSCFIPRGDSTTTIGYRGAISFIERKRVPSVGPAKDRQVLRKLASVFNNDTVCSLVCFVCAQTHTKTPSANSHIDWHSGGWFASLNKAKETLEANCGYEQWRGIYGSQKPLDVYGPGQHKDAPLEEWCLEVDLCPAVCSIIHVDVDFMFF